MALSPDMLKEHFNEVKKCKVEWKIIKMEDLNEDNCLNQRSISILWNDNNYYSIKGIFPKKWCIIDWYNKLFFEGDIKIWTDVSYIINEKNMPLDYYPWTVDIWNIPYCTWNIIKNTKEKSTSEIQNTKGNYNSQIYIFSWIIISLIIIIWFLSFKIYKKPTIK